MTFLTKFAKKTRYFAVSQGLEILFEPKCSKHNPLVEQRTFLEEIVIKRKGV